MPARDTRSRHSWWYRGPACRCSGARRHRIPRFGWPSCDGGADYADAIELGNGIAATEGYYPEGGARNAARRDGMGTALLAAVEAAGRVPDHYFQAVGSGTGAIAAWEMSLRLRDDGRFSGGQMKLHLSQNAPFTPITDAWEAGTRSMAPPPDGRRLTRSIRASVLGNRNPPYSIAGGLYDALADTRGFMYRVTNADARASGRLFAKLEGCDIDPAAEVACASLVQAVRTGQGRHAGLRRAEHHRRRPPAAEA